MLRFVTVLVSKGHIIEGPYVTCDLDPEGTRELWKVLSQSDQGVLEAGRPGRKEPLWLGLGQRPV